MFAARNTLVKDRWAGLLIENRTEVKSYVNVTGITQSA